VDIGGESRGYEATANRGSRGGACGEAAAPGEVSNPDKREMDEGDGVIMSSTRSAPALAVVASKAGMAMPKRGVLAPLEISSTGGQLPVEDRDEGQTTVGEDTGSGVSILRVSDFPSKLSQCSFRSVSS
jgi:hypothetical protein